jgi:hypothetical protein
MVIFADHAPLFLALMLLVHPLKVLKYETLKRL